MLRLESARACVEVDLDAGGRIALLEVDGLSLLVPGGPEVDPMDWGCYVMAPYAGRVRHGRFTFDGTERELVVNRPPHAQHGTVLDVRWEDLGGGRLRSDLGSDWPWRGHVEQTLDLRDDRLLLRAVVHATEAPMPVSLGWHPWFRRRLATGGDVDLDVRPVAAYAVDDEMIPTGAVVAPPARPWDDCFTALEAPVVLDWPDALRLEVTSDCTTWVVYDRPVHAVCVEPQTARPDALGAGAPIARPGEPVEAWMCLRWG